MFVTGGPECLFLMWLNIGYLRCRVIKRTMIQNMIKEGKIVPSEVTNKLLLRAIQESINDKFLIDGFPRNEENRTAFESDTGIVPEIVLFFDCPEEEMERRLLSRNQGREDDNIETVRKRFKVYMESTLPVIEHYNSRGKVRKIDAAKSVEDVFEDVKAVFATIDEKIDAAKLVGGDAKAFFVTVDDQVNHCCNTVCAK
ncbi:hypothetical protein Nepgr_002502 [Nepenthes gracilis]|uniref:adenylate kinase n=1 Tax=Nepenthes gracilis TaxID=150966 RepID=A0AAD3RYA4_NEPGR|nr:hypothetical protein Nepgr_002502 [Nepenthes gracilis]